jgi:hypothetical protein
MTAKMKSIRRALWVLTMTLAGCSRAFAPGGSLPAVSQPESMASETSQPTLAPETVIDGYTIGKARPDCPLTNPECAKILALAKAAILDSAAGLAQIADCSLSASECIAFIGQPAREGYSRSVGMGELVGLAETAMLVANKSLDSSSIIGFHLYDESMTSWIAPDGHWIKHRTGSYDIIVFEFVDGSSHAAGVGCVVGSCHATR